MPHSQPASARPTGRHPTDPDAARINAPAPVATDDDGSELPTVRVRETGTGPFRVVVVDVPAGVHPASLVTALRSLPIACEFVNMADLAGTRSGGELRFRVHDGHAPLRRPASTYGGIGTRVPWLDEDNPLGTDQPTDGAR